jgi:hypothetical protein
MREARPNLRSHPDEDFDGGGNNFLCPFAVYYLRYAVTSFFTMSRISLAEGKTAGQKVHRKIAGAVQNVKTPLHFIPLF